MQKPCQNMNWNPLVEWFEEGKRNFPWREEKSPYRVWISEVMLQQTQAVVVIPYFNRWISLFPTVEALAKAPLDQVMKAWEGLGYYSRVRHLHETAAKIVHEHGGILPSNREKLAELKGFGPYTIGAVLSFAFHQKAAAVDGNVIRVMARLFALQDDASQKKRYEAKVEALLPNHEPWVVMEALIELGAVICRRKPDCASCPLQDQCLGYRKAIAEALPIRKPAQAAILLKREVAVIEAGSFLLLRQVEVGKVMGGLFEFPYIDQGELWPFDLRKVKVCDLPRVKHTFTKYRATLFPSVWKAEEKKELKGYDWVPFDQVKRLPFSSGHRRVLNEYFTHRRVG